VFIVGMIFQSAIYFLAPYEFDVPATGIILYCTRGAAQILLKAPTLLYLERCTTTFTPLIITSIFATGVTGVILKTIQILFQTDVRYQLIVSMLLGFEIVVFLLTVMTSIILYFLEKYVTRSNRRYCNNSYVNSIYDYLIPIKSNNTEDKDKVDLMYTHYIPGMHMFAWVIIGVTSAAWVLGLISFEVENYCTLIGQVIFLVIELRIRKNEVGRGLIALLDSKKLYVRYISHELRTPLNTAYLGLLNLQLLLFDFPFSLLTPYWLVCIIRLENRFCSTSRYNLFK
jgi:signal transduction histidine kinase